MISNTQLLSFVITEDFKILFFYLRLQTYGSDSIVASEELNHWNYISALKTLDFRFKLLENLYFILMLNACNTYKFSRFYWYFRIY